MKHIQISRREDMTHFDQWLLMMYNENCKERMYYKIPAFANFWDYYQANKEFLENKYNEEFYYEPKA